MLRKEPAKNGQSFMGRVLRLIFSIYYDEWYCNTPLKMIYKMVLTNNFTGV